MLKLVEHPERNLPVVLFALQICTLVAATMVGVVADQAFGPWGVVLATLFEVVLIFVFAELAPKIWAVQHVRTGRPVHGPLPSWPWSGSRRCAGSRWA